MRYTFTRLLSATALITFLGITAQAQTAAYTPLAVTGFNQDVVANGSGLVTASTTYDLDGSGGTGYCFMAPTYVNPSGAAPSRFLPANGLITSTTVTGLTYQLQAYTANNSLRIPTTGSNATGTGALMLATPRTAGSVYLLLTSGDGNSLVTPSIIFTDGTSQVFPSQTVLDWFDGANPVAQGLGRVSRNAASSIENNATNPRLYQLVLTLAAANYAKPIQSITFNKTSTTGVLNIMAATVTNSPLAVRTGLADLIVKAYPSPATETVTLRADKAAPFAEACLLDLTGRGLQAAPVQNQQAVFSLNGLPAGVYLLRYSTGQGSKTIKITKE